MEPNSLKSLLRQNLKGKTNKSYGNDTPSSPFEIEYRESNIRLYWPFSPPYVQCSLLVPQCSQRTFRIEV